MKFLLRTTVPVLALGLLVGCFALGSAPAGAEGEADLEARKAKILANLQLRFPQLAQLNPTMGALEASDFDGLDKGSFIVRGQSQVFLVSKDDTQLFLVQGEPIDVSRSADEIAAEVAKQEEAKAQEALARRSQLDQAIEGRPMRGNPDAKITIVEFSDFQCPYCTRGAETVEQILEKYPNDVRFVFKHFPLGFHPWAKPAAIAANCAANQNHDVFWTLHDKYFEHQKELTPENVMAKTKEYLDGADLDMATWSACAEDQATAEHKAASALVDQDMNLGKSLGVSGTPGFFVNGTFLNGAQPITAFEPLIQKAKAEG